MRLLLFTMHLLDPETDTRAPIVIAMARTPAAAELAALVAAKIDPGTYMAGAVPRILEREVGLTDETLRHMAAVLAQRARDGAAWPSMEREHQGVRFSLQLADVEFLPAELDGAGWQDPNPMAGLSAMRAGMKSAGLRERDGRIEREDGGL